MNCSTCTYWKIIGTTGSERGDAQMAELGYKNCVKDQSEFGSARFLYGESTKCDKYEVHEAKEV